MTTRGTAAYEQAGDLPKLVAAAVAAARRAGFGNSCGPEHGELLRTLARGAGAGVIGETGTGCGVGLAWLASGAHADARLISVEHDPAVAGAAAEVFAADPRVEIIVADWRALVRHGPFDLLVLDGGGHGKTGADPIDVAAWLRPGAMLAIDDFTPSREWPPLFGGQPDRARLHWLRHPAMLTTEVPVTPSSASLVGRYTGDRRTAELPEFQFAFPGPLRDALVAAVLSGAKTTTTGLLQDWQLDRVPLPVAGDRAAVVDSGGRRVAVIELIHVAVRRLADVDAGHALDEGEGHDTVAAWRAGHEEYWHGPDYRGWLGDPAFTVADDTLAVLQRFRLVRQ